MRHTGIDVIGDVPWGTHFCQFYETSQDLIETLVPYFKAGLEANEFCMWVTSEPLQVRQARAALKAVVPGLEKRIRKGQIEIIDYKKWYVPSGRFSADKVLKGWTDRLEAALARGYEGLRLSGNTFWLEQADWDDFRKYEEAVDSVIGQRRMMAMCTYSLRKCGASEIIDVVANHEFALIKRQGRWEIIESAARKQAEETIRKEALKYTKVLQTAHAGFWVSDLEGKILEVNDAYCLMSGYSREELLGMRISDIEAKESPGEILDHARFVREHGHHNFETRHRRKDGTIFDAEVRASHLDIEGGRMVVFTWDISERKKMERAIRDSESQLRFLAETASRLLEVDNPQEAVNELCHKALERLGCQVFFNFLVDETTQRLHLNAWGGIPAEEARRIEWLDYGAAVCGCVARDGVRIVAEDIPTSPDPRTDLVRSYGIQAYACHPLLSRGELIGTLSFGTRTRAHFRNDELELMKTIADQVAIAIERVRERQTLFESEERFRTMADGSPFILYVTDARGGIQFINRTYRAYFGLTPEQVVGEGRRPLVHPDDVEAYVEEFNRSVRERGPLAAEARVRRHDGQWRWIASHAQPRFSPNGEFLGHVGSSVDITDRKLAEEKTRRRNAVLDGIHRMFREALACETEEEVGAICLKVAEEVTGSRFGFIGEIGPDGRLNDIAISDPGWAACRISSSSGHKQAPVGLRVHGLYGRVILDGRGLIANSPSSHPDSIGVPEGHPPLTAFMGAPLLQSGKTIGIMALGNRDGGYGQEDLADLEALAAPIVQVIMRRRAEETLRQTREHLEKLIDYANAPIIVWDPGFRITTFNHAFERLTGLTADKVIGRPLDTLFPESTRQESLDYIQRTLTGERWEVVEIPILKTDGAVRTVLWNSANIYGKDGATIIATIAQGQDITERKQAEESLRRSEATLRGILNATQESIWLFSPDAVVLSANETALRRFGMELDEVAGKHFSEILPPELARTRQESLERVLATKRPVESEDQRAGILFRHSWYPVQDDQGGITGVACFSRDITERRRAEVETRRLATFPVLNPQPIVEIDCEGRVGFVNPAAQRLFPELQAAGSSHPWFGDWSTLTDAFASSGGALPPREIPVGDRWYLQNMYFVPEAQRLRIYGIDISRQKLAEEELRRHAEELEKARVQAENEKLRLEAVMEALPIGVSILDSRGGIIKVNPSFERVWGGPAPETRSVRDYAAYQAWWPETGIAVNPEEWAAAQAILRGEPVTGQQFEIQRFDGSRAHVINSAAPVRDPSGNIVGSAVAIQDITELRQSQEELRRLNRTLTALSHSNQALMHAKDEKEFLEEACQVIVRDCGHAMVWIGYAEDDEKKSVRPVAFAGFEDGYVEALKISWADNERGRGPTGTAIRTGKPCACIDMLSDPKFAPWREPAIARGYASSLVLPLLMDGRAFGAISIYFEKPGAVSEDEMRLLTELSNDVAYGISSIRLREAHARAEKALRESEERLKTFAAATFEGIVLTDRGIILDCNSQFAEMAGRPAPELRGTTVEQLVAPEDRGRVMASIRPNRESLIEHQIVRPDGSRLTVEVHGRPSGGLRLSAVRDITERKSAEEALRQRTQELQQLTDTLEQRVRERTAELAEANELLQAEVTHSHFIEADLTRQKETLQTLVDNIPVMLCIYDAEGKAKLTNREFERLLGWSTVEAEGLDIAPGRTRGEAAHTGPADSAAEGIPGWREYRIKTHEGAGLESSWATVRLSDGGQIGIGLDMRERKAAEAERLRLAAAVEQAWEGMAIMDSEGRIRYANSAFEETSAASRKEIIGRRYYDLLNEEPENRDLAEEARKTAASGETWSSHVTRRKAEQSRELDIRITPIRDRAGNIINYLVVERDVTREYRLQQHLRQAQKLEALGTLAGGIAHDFNNILNPIFINTELVLLDAALDEESRRELELSLKAAERGRDLVRQIITFSRQKEKERKPTRIGPVVKEALKFLRSTIPTQVEIREHVEPETGFILADPSQVHQIVMNLCNNSAYAMRERGGVLDVALAEVEVDSDMAMRHPDIKPGPFLRLTVTDTGTGMTPEVIERAFDPFFTTKKPGEGSGMGLAVVHGIVRDYEGAVTVYSEVGKGTTFNIFFPRVRLKPLEIQEAAEVLPKGRERILLVDDEEAQVQSMRNMLKRLGHRIVSATDPEEALKVFRKDPTQFDLVITDQIMPKLTGARLAEEILRLRPALPIILCTGFSERVDANGAHAMGITGFLMKPFSIREMAAAINNAVKKE